MILSIAGVAALAGGLLLAQATGVGRMRRGEHLRQFIANRLGLTDSQKAQAKAIFDAAREQAKPLAEQLKQGHADITAAVKADKSDAELQALADKQGSLTGQLAGIHAKSMAKFYALLTPDQKAKADQLHGRMRGFIAGARWGAAHP